MDKTGNSNPKQVKKQAFKTNTAMGVGLGAIALAGLVYVVYKHRNALISGGSAAAKNLGPIVSRVLPAIVLGALFIWLGPETLIGSVPAGLIFGPELMSGMAKLFGEK